MSLTRGGLVRRRFGLGGDERPPVEPTCPPGVSSEAPRGSGL